MDKTSAIIGLIMLALFVLPFVAVSLYRRNHKSND